MALPVLHLNEIPQDGLSLSCDVGVEELTLGPDDVRIPGGLAVALNAISAGTTVHVTGTLRGTARRQCVRCLNDYDEALWLPIVGEYHRDTDHKPRAPGRDRSEQPGEDAGDDTYVYTGEVIELGEMLREQVLLATPMQPLCREACPGLCPVCGQDLNERRCECREQEIPSPFNVLRKLRETTPDPSKRTTKAK